MNNKPSPWMCGKCLYSFDTCDSLAMHMMTKHANEPDNNMAIVTLPDGQQQMVPANNPAELVQNAMQQVSRNLLIQVYNDLAFSTIQ